MSITLRRVLYGLLTALGFLMMLPLMVNIPRLQSEILADPLAGGLSVDPATAEWAVRLLLVYLLGLVVATGFLYLALTTGVARAWRPRENGEPRCRRCGVDLRFGVGRCPRCDQQLVW